MSTLIAVSGKGGVGKTTLSALLIRALVRSGRIPILAVDADPNSCLDAALGVAVHKSVGAAREEVRAQTAAGQTGISKTDLLHLKVSESLVESKDFDLIAMGRPEGAGCYCYANNVVKSILAGMTDAYPYVVLDNEAGLENLSRRIVQKVQMLLLVSDPSKTGVQTLDRLYALACEMGIGFETLGLVINRARSETKPASLTELACYPKADFVLLLPDDPEIAAFAEDSRPLLDISPGNPVAEKIEQLLNAIQ